MACVSRSENYHEEIMEASKISLGTYTRTLGGMESSCCGIIPGICSSRYYDLCFVSTGCVMIKGYLALIGYIATIFLANYFIKNIGIQFDPNGPHLFPVWFGVYAPSGTLFAGLAFTFRDFVQDTLDKVWVFGAIILGAALSAFVSADLAVASGIAFLISELADLAVYTPMKRYSWLLAVVLSNTVGLAFDSILFVSLANLPIFLLTGQIIGKLWSTALAVIGILIYEYFLSRNTSSAVDAKQFNSIDGE